MCCHLQTGSFSMEGAPEAPEVPPASLHKVDYLTFSCPSLMGGSEWMCHAHTVSLPEKARDSAWAEYLFCFLLWIIMDSRKTPVFTECRV